MDILALLFPQEKKFYRMIEEQVSLVGYAVSDFHKLITHFDKLSPSARKKLIIDISNKEKKDDILYTRMIRALKSTFITPMDREDIHRLVVTFDNIVDTLELLSLKINAFDIRKIDIDLKNQTVILNKAFQLIEKLIFSIRSETQVEKYCLEVRKLEQEGDRIFIKSLSYLFSDSTQPLTVIKLKDLYASLENMIDLVNEAALIIENIAVKYS